MHISTNNKPRLNGETNTEDEIKGRKIIRKQQMQHVIITKSNEREIHEVRRRMLFSSPENEWQKHAASTSTNPNPKKAKKMQREENDLKQREGAE